MEKIIKINGLNFEFFREGKGRDILFIHGLNSNYGLFKKIILKLSKNYKCWALNLPKYGKCKVEDYVEILKQFIKLKNIQKPFLIGHSLGGIICLKLIEDKINYSGLATICTPLIEKAPRVTIMLLDLFNMLIKKGIFKSYLDGFNDVTNGIIKAPKIKIEKPFLVIYGKYDLIVKLSKGEAYEIFKPKKIVYGNFGHLAPLTHPENISIILKEFLNIS